LLRHSGCCARWKKRRQPNGNFRGARGGGDRTVEIARSLARYAERLDLDPEQLATLEQRVTLLET